MEMKVTVCVCVCVSHDSILLSTVGSCEVSKLSSTSGEASAKYVCIHFLSLVSDTTVYQYHLTTHFTVIVRAS